MSIKRILLPLPGSAEHAGEIEMALTAAKTLGAHVEALFITEPPPPTRVSAGDLSYISRSTALAPKNLYAEERDRAVAEAHDRFMQACAAIGIPLLSPNDDPGSPLAASWLQSEGSYVEVAVQRAAAFDLLVAAGANIMQTLKDIAEGSLLQTRRPVLLAPNHLTTKLSDSAMIAWDESPECWHAVSAALPFLQVAKDVRVVSVDRYADRRKTSQDEVLAYLRCHGINATTKVVAPELRTVGDSLLATAADQEIGLVVMGAYSHSRLREMLLGGATRHILMNSTARPVLLAH